MSKETTTFGLSSKKLVNLLKIAEETRQAHEKVDQQRLKTELLHDYLAQTLEVYKYAGEKRPSKQGQLRKTINILSTEPIGKLLHNPETEIGLIRMVKDCSSKFSKRAQSKTEHQIANTIYYAAIAHALLFHGRKITRYTHENLEKSFSKLAREKRLPKQMVDLFAEVADICHRKASQE